MRESQIKFHQPITRIEIDSYSNKLYLECRDDKKQPIFYSLDLIQEKQAKGITIDLPKEDFFFHTVLNDFMVLSKAVDPANMTDQVIWVYDLRTYNLIEKITGKKFSGFAGDSTLVLMSLGFQDIMKEELDLSPYRNASLVGKTMYKVHYPVPVSSGTKHYELLSGWMENHFTEEVTFDFEVLEYNGFILFSVHLKGKDTFIKVFVIINDKAEPVLKSTISKSIEKRSHDTFFVYANFVIFVSEFRILNLIELSHT